MSEARLQTEHYAGVSISKEWQMLFYKETCKCKVIHL